MNRVFAGLAALALCCSFSSARFQPENPDDPRGVVSVASLVYANDKTAVCFSSDFLNDIRTQTSVLTNPSLQSVNADSMDLYNYPFAIMTGEKSFALTQSQRQNLRDYLEGGGFLVASAGCSSREWSMSFRQEIERMFPERELKILTPDHPVFKTVYSIKTLKTKRSTAHLEGLEIDGRIALIFSEDGLNDTAHAGGSCCCCGGDEITNARDINVNLLAYALTH